MNDLIKEFKDLIERRGLSPEQASHYIGCAAKSVYRWLADEMTPSLASQRQIRQAIQKIRRELARETTSVKINRYYKILTPVLTHEEKAELFDLSGPSENSRVKYLKRMKELAESHGIEIEED